MRHYRIKEIEKDNNKEFIIQYTFIFLYIIVFWRRYNKIPYQKYEDAVLETKKIINAEKDYSRKKKNKTIKYYYIDPFKVTRSIAPQTITPEIKSETSRYNRSVFTPKETK